MKLLTIFSAFQKANDKRYAIAVADGERGKYYRAERQLIAFHVALMLGIEAKLPELERLAEIGVAVEAMPVTHNLYHSKDGWERAEVHDIYLDHYYVRDTALEVLRAAQDTK